MFLGLDLGTTNVKAIVADAGGSILARGAAPVKLIHLPGGGVEQDIEDIWRATVSAIERVGEETDLSGVRAVGVSSQGGALQLIDGEGNPVGPVVSWLDGRGKPYDDDLTRRLGGEWFAAHTGHGSSGVGIGEVLRLRDGDPGQVSPPNAIGFVGDVVVSRLCGRRAHDATSLSIGMFYNPRLRTADPDLLREVGVTERQLPALLSARTPAGELMPGVSERTGIPANVPVSAAVHDQYAATVGSGAVHAGDVMFGAGTAWVLLAASADPGTPVSANSFMCTHVVQDLYGQMLTMGNGGSSFEWAARVLQLDGRATGELDAMMESVPAGCEGLRFWPLLSAGGGAGLLPGAHGRLLGLRLSHEPAHILRAVVEGLAMELARYVRLFTNGGMPVERLVMNGGATKSRVTPQVIADATGLPVSCGTESDMSAFGAAVIARGLIEPHAGLAELAEAMTPAVELLTPGADRDVYRPMFEEYCASLPIDDKRRRAT